MKPNCQMPSLPRLGGITSECCFCLVWSRSNYVRLVDTQFHSSMRLITVCTWPTQVQWLPVLAIIAPPHLYRKAVTDKMLDNISAHLDWPSYADVFEHSPPQLTSRRPIWSDMTPVDISEQWQKDLLSASVVNNVLITDPTIRQPWFNLPCQSWSLLNHFQDSSRPLSLQPTQMGSHSHVVNICPFAMFGDGVQSYMKPVMMQSTSWSQSTGWSKSTSWSLLYYSTRQMKWTSETTEIESENICIL